ncbi:MBL fold metallo-hydrolase [Mesorhizobium sp. C280B]|uniref:MBL fold metallo-hydrolase n=1 Tax=unclassified Mesorhizobium TaxID=325217 RepID=UPI0004CE57A7|nr:MBL fold metallo-hydrolase [Mesorhizobium sp. LSJC280B00]
MHCEVEFLPVGSGSKAGDAIVVRYGDAADYHLILVDGGHAETGDNIVAHLKKQFGPFPVLEHVVLTHSDADHASGLRTVLSEIPVRNLWMHIPWLLAEESRHLFSDKRWTPEGLKAAVKAEYGTISEIYDLAVEAGCNIFFPFQGADIGPFRVCSPKRATYNYLLPQFEKTPDPDQGAIEAAHIWIGKESLTHKIFEAAKAALQGWTEETWDNERLKDGGITSASNESSVVLYGAFENNARVLLTGDTGVSGLWWTASYAESVGLPLQQFTFVQIPHHGSRRNVGPTVLTKLLGEKQPEGAAYRFSAYVSAPKDDAKHPRRMVLNAFKRRGGLIIATQGGSKVHWGGFPARPGYSVAEGLPFYTQVEEYT